MVMWEYKITRIDMAQEYMLNEWGKEGWEVISIQQRKDKFPAWDIVLKRKIISPQEEKILAWADKLREDFQKMADGAL